MIEKKKKQRGEKNKERRLYIEDSFKIQKL